ncbi:hypothetical protein BDP27DRAFT_1316752 [Rhodocollybia butyracea]|uniref:CUE domain-containing protein n=1 Tax=Rhodocollybia butyracea TaxID=206335 RepID=A0A9P5Q621_9AGAR|nr:hypothetical protein BDP27DRAFT_1316752 [Rhodocollybia butyracea]
MGEVVNVVVAFAVIVFIFRWATSSSPANNNNPSPADTLGFRPKNVTQDMVDTIGNMFPDIPRDNIRYELLRTGSVERTTNKILEKGFLDAPPPSYFTLYPRAVLNPTAGAPGPANNATSSSVKPETLISRFNLQSRIKGDAPTVIPEEEVGGKARWEDTPEKREESLRERKAKMILAARQRMLAAQKEKEAA